MTGGSPHTLLQSNANSIIPAASRHCSRVDFCFHADVERLPSANGRAIRVHRRIERFNNVMGLRIVADLPA